MACIHEPRAPSPSLSCFSSSLSEPPFRRLDPETAPCTPEKDLTPTQCVLRNVLQMEPGGAGQCGGHSPTPSDEPPEHFANSVLKLHENEAGGGAEAGHCAEGGAVRGQSDEGRIQCQSGAGFLEGLFGCLKPVWTMIGKAYSTEHKQHHHQACLRYSTHREVDSDVSELERCLILYHSQRAFQNPGARLKKKALDKLRELLSHSVLNSPGSFGVVLWEMLTGEVPYKDVDSSAIIWGVGNNSLQLPIPESCPDGFKILLRQCWNCKPRNRPSFRQILLHLDIASADLLSTPQETYFKSQLACGTARTEKWTPTSFGVVLWEMLTGEVPYKDVDSSAIIWGVGNNSLQLPIPESCPDGFKILLRQCWNCKPRNRPSFRQILLHLDIASADLLSTPQETYFKSQAEWREEVKQHFEKIKSEGTCLHRLDEELVNRRREELRHALDIREHYERKLERANNLYMELNAVMLQLELKEKELHRREQSMDKKHPGLFKPHTPRPAGPANSMDKLIKKRNVPQKLPSHNKRPDLLKSEVILPKLDSSMTQVTIPAHPNKGSTSPGRSRRGKPRYRKAGKGSSGDLAGLKAALSPAPLPAMHLDPSAALRGLQHDLLLKKMSSSSPDLISTTLEAEDREKGEAGMDRGSRSASGGLGGAETEDLTETPPRSDTPSEDAASIPFSSSPDSPCGRGGAAGRGSALGQPRPPQEGEEKEEGPGGRLPRGGAGGSGQPHLTPAAILYRAAVTRKQKRGISSEEEGEVDSEVDMPRRQRRPAAAMSKCQSLSAFSSENLSVSDGEEGNTSDHSHSGTPDVVSTNTDERLDDKSDDLLSQSSEIPVDMLLHSDGLSEKEAAVREVKTQLNANVHENPPVYDDSDCDSAELDNSGSAEASHPSSTATW
ncbi:UNVERIFIED_CONTAM: hypothetical protein FKN15_002568 [Acipenser sinensis]